MARPAPALMLLVLAALVGPSVSVPAARSMCPAAQASKVVAAATCGCESALDRCLSREAPVMIDSSVLQTCLIRAGCAKAEASSQAVVILQSCGGATSQPDLRRRGAILLADSVVADVDKRDGTGDKPTSESSSSSSSSGSSRSSEDQTTKATTQGDTTLASVTTGKPGQATPTPAPKTASASPNAASSSSTGLVCSTTTFVSTTQCTTGSAGGTCFSTTVPTITCAAGLLCQDNDQGEPACKVAVGFGVSGIIIATIGGIYIAGCIVGLFYCCLQDRRKSKRVALEEAEALLAAKDEAKLKKKEATRAAKAGKAAAYQAEKVAADQAGVTKPLVWGGEEEPGANSMLRVCLPVPPYTPMNPDEMMQLHVPAPPYPAEAPDPAAGQGPPMPLPANSRMSYLQPPHVGHNSRLPIAQSTAIRSPQRPRPSQIPTQSLFPFPHGPSGEPVEVPPGELPRQVAELLPSSKVPLNNPLPDNAHQGQPQRHATTGFRSKDDSVSSRRQQTTAEPYAGPLGRPPAAVVPATGTVLAGTKPLVKGTKKPTLGPTRPASTSTATAAAAAAADATDESTEPPSHPKGLRKSSSHSTGGASVANKLRKSSTRQTGGTVTVEGDPIGEGDELLKTVAVMDRPLSNPTKSTKSHTASMSADEAGACKGDKKIGKGLRKKKSSAGGAGEGQEAGGS